MFVLTALALASAPATADTARMSDCKPVLALAASERDTGDNVRAPAPQRRGDPRPKPSRRCMTLASA